MAIVCSVQRAGNRIALTFDDGPSTGYTEQILQTLGQHEARATFFIQGAALDAEGCELVEQARAAHHEIGNHTHQHRDLSSPNAPLSEEIRTTHELLTNLLGAPPRVIRPPMGRGSDKVDAHAATLGYEATVLWNVSPEDWTTPRKELIVERVMAGYCARHDDIERHCGWSPNAQLPGAIVLLHDGAPHDEEQKSRHPTVRAVREIIPRLQELGLELVTVSELLAARS